MVGVALTQQGQSFELSQARDLGLLWAPVNLSVGFSLVGLVSQADPLRTPTNLGIVWILSFVKTEILKSHFEFVIRKTMLVFFN